MFFLWIIPPPQQRSMEASDPPLLYLGSEGSRISPQCVSWGVHGVSTASLAPRVLLHQFP